MQKRTRRTTTKKIKKGMITYTSVCNMQATEAVCLLLYVVRTRNAVREMQRERSTYTYCRLYILSVIRNVLWVCDAKNF